MDMSPFMRKLTLTAHVASSVGWLGAVATSLALAMIGLTSGSVDAARASYLLLEPVGWSVLVPLSLATLLTGLVQALGTRWGLLRHYWVLLKLVMTVVAGVVLLLYMPTLSLLADRAALPGPGDRLTDLRDPSPALHAALALLLLLVALTLSVYKPRGMTRYGQRTQRATARAAGAQFRQRKQDD
jgi:hypothetical protein